MSRRSSLFLDRPVITEELSKDLNASLSEFESDRKMRLPEFLARQQVKEELKLRNLERIKSYVTLVLFVQPGDAVWLGGWVDVGVVDVGGGEVVAGGCGCG
jgi:hypothetical protein